MFKSKIKLYLAFFTFFLYQSFPSFAMRDENQELINKIKINLPNPKPQQERIPIKIPTKYTSTTISQIPQKHVSQINPFNDYPGITLNIKENEGDVKFEKDASSSSRKLFSDRINNDFQTLDVLRNKRITFDGLTDESVDDFVKSAFPKLLENKVFCIIFNCQQGSYLDAVLRDLYRTNPYFSVFTDNKGTKPSWMIDYEKEEYEVDSPEFVSESYEQQIKENKKDKKKILKNDFRG